MKWSLIKTQPNGKLKMRSKIQHILSKSQFFKIINSTNISTTYALEKPSQILKRNIYINWLRYINLKTLKSMPIYLHKTTQDHQKTTKGKLPYGIINQYELEFKDKTFEIHDAPSITTDSLELKLIIPRQDYMQYFIQWQRYRKYWWSSITTTPSLFAIGDIKQGDNTADADIVAKLPSGHQTVEVIKIDNIYNDFKDSACLTCTMSLERALLFLLLDGSIDDPKDEYLRLHRKIAPYKMSFALSYEELKNKQTLMDLAALLFHSLYLKDITSYLPDFSMTLNEQICRNLQMGIPYTAILDETTLQNGILHLMNSSTMLKEQIHVADFHTYAGLICNAK